MIIKTGKKKNIIFAFQNTAVVYFLELGSNFGIFVFKNSER